MPGAYQAAIVHNKQGNPVGPALNAIAVLATDLRDIAAKFVDPAWSGGRRERIPVNWLHHDIVLLEIGPEIDKNDSVTNELNQNDIVHSKAGVTDTRKLEKKE